MMNVLPITDARDVAVVFGALRSGTTMLRLMIDRNPHLSCLDETDFLFDHIGTDRQGVWRLNRDALSEDRIFLAQCLPVPQSDDAVAAVHEMLVGLQAKARGTLVLMLHRNLDKLLAIFPDMRLVHLLRDPRDVARSSIQMGWAGNLWHGVGHWMATEREWSQATARLSQAQIFELTYERLVSAPDDALPAMCDFLRVPYSPDMLRFHETSTYQPIDPSLIEQWRRKLSPQELALVEARIGDMLTERGYQPSGVTARAPERMRRLQLAVQNKFATWRFRFARFGVADPLVEWLSYRLGWSELGRSARRRIAEVTTSHLK